MRHIEQPEIVSQWSRGQSTTSECTASLVSACCAGETVTHSEQADHSQLGSYACRGALASRLRRLPHKVGSWRAQQADVAGEDALSWTQLLQRSGQNSF